MEIAKEIVKYNLRRAFAVWGIEGTEDKIKELCTNMVTKNYVLGIYREILDKRTEQKW